MDEAFKDACLMFGENPKTKEPSEFFQIFINFINQFKVSLNFYIMKEELLLHTAY